MSRLPRTECAEWTACGNDRAAHSSCRGQRRQRVHRLPHAEDRGDPRRRDGAQPHLPFRVADADRHNENSERLQSVSHRQDDGVGDRGAAKLGGSLALAGAVVRRFRGMRRTEIYGGCHDPRRLTQEQAFCFASARADGSLPGSSSDFVQPDGRYQPQPIVRSMAPMRPLPTSAKSRSNCSLSAPHVRGERRGA